MMGPHGVFHTCVGVVSVLHGDVAIAVANLGRGYGRAGQVLLRGQSTLVLVVLETSGRLRLRLAIVIISGRHLVAAIVSSRATSRIGVRLPLIHGCCRARRPNTRFCYGCCDDCVVAGLDFGLRVGKWGPLSDGAADLASARSTNARRGFDALGGPKEVQDGLTAGNKARGREKVGNVLAVLARLHPSQD